MFGYAYNMLILRREYNYILYLCKNIYACMYVCVCICLYV